MVSAEKNPAQLRSELGAEPEPIIEKGEGWEPNSFWRGEPEGRKLNLKWRGLGAGVQNEIPSTVEPKAPAYKIDVG